MQLTKAEPKVDADAARGRRRSRARRGCAPTRRPARGGVRRWKAYFAHKVRVRVRACACPRARARAGCG